MSIQRGDIVMYRGQAYYADKPRLGRVDLYDRLDKITAKFYIRYNAHESLVTIAPPWIRVISNPTSEEIALEKEMEKLAKLANIRAEESKKASDNYFKKYVNSIIMGSELSDSD
jgi:hypothetical protein